MVAENLAFTGIRSPDRPARSKSQYRLSSPGPYHSKLAPSLNYTDIRYVVVLKS